MFSPKYIDTEGTPLNIIMGIQNKKKLSNEKFHIKCYYKDTVDPKNF